MADIENRELSPEKEKDRLVRQGYKYFTKQSTPFKPGYKDKQSNDRFHDALCVLVRSILAVEDLPPILQTDKANPTLQKCVGIAKPYMYKRGSPLEYDWTSDEKVLINFLLARAKARGFNYEQEREKYRTIRENWEIRKNDAPEIKTWKGKMHSASYYATLGLSALVDTMLTDTLRKERQPA